MVAKSFVPKEVPNKNLYQNFFGPKFFMVANSFLRKQLPTKKFYHKCFDRKFLYGAKNISSKTGS